MFCYVIHFKVAYPQALNDKKKNVFLYGFIPKDLLFLERDCRCFSWVGSALPVRNCYKLPHCHLTYTGNLVLSAAEPGFLFSLLSQGDPHCSTCCSNRGWEPCVLQDSSFFFNC
ncbi:hypothetical protein GDO81_009244 [Engystomops pustulosus]|uniref:Uncharacterized protein n=1 Tax=Engystomops pustulosus TaxID=76066 RepID=A0AAV7BQD2_ENGPU|nr:hypothetical protein GDO81_009244 [Engystomops pustulosus]